MQIQLGQREQQTLRYRRLKATVTSCAFFDRLLSSSKSIKESSIKSHELYRVEVVSKSGSINRLQDEYFDGCAVNDRLREMMINPESSFAEVFTKSERTEFIYQLFRAIVVGGALCQAEDFLEPYMEMTRRLYKSLISVKKNASDPNTIDITSRVYSVEIGEDQQYTKESLFPHKSPFNSCFAIIDSKKRWITVWHNAFQPFW